MTTVYCSPPLARLTGGAPEIEGPDGSLESILVAISQEFPALVDAVLDGSRPRAGVLIFVDGVGVSDIKRSGTLTADSRIDLITIAYGG